MSIDPEGDTDEYPVWQAPSEADLRPPVPVPFQVDLGALSHRGTVRPNNEDFYLVVRADRGLETLLTNLPEGRVPHRFHEVAYGMVVADGMGGMAAGEIASQQAITLLVNLLLNQPDWIMRTGERENDRLLKRIARRYSRVHAALKEEAQADANLAGMATTMTLALSLGPDLFLGHVGDSRAYLLRGGKLHQLTRDHTCAQALADAGILRPEEVMTHQLRHVLTRALGGSCAHVRADVQRVRLDDGDQVLLCTDGLTGMVDDATIAAILDQPETADDACRALVEAALERGGRDNVTAVLARYRFDRQP